jgi:hypothetical protein
MRKLAIAISVVLATFLSCEAAVSGERESVSSSSFGKLFQRTRSTKSAAREVELKALLAIRSDQETAWLEYVMARRQYAEAADRNRRQEYMSWAAGDASLDLNSLASGEDGAVQAYKSALKEKYDVLYAMFDEAQKALADRELTAGECGR